MDKLTILGTRIKKRRKALGLNQGQLADAIAVTQAAISRYEAGANDPTSEVITDLARALKTSTDWLLGLSNDGDVNVVAPAVGLELTPTEFEIMRAVRAFPEEKHQALLDLLNDVRRIGL